MPYNIKFQVGAGGTHSVTAQRLHRSMGASIEAETNPARDKGEMASTPFAGLNFDHKYRRPRATSFTCL